MLSYKGFYGSTEYDDDAEVFCGTVINANTVMAFRGSSVKELQKSFRDIVDSYIEDCARDGVEPEKLFSGKITVRISPEMHKGIASKASECKESMNSYLEELIYRDLAGSTDGPKPCGDRRR